MPLGSPVVPEVKRIWSGVSVRQAGDGAHLRGGKLAEPILEGERGNGGPGVRCSQFSQQERIADGEPGIDVSGYARGKIGGSGGVEGDGQHAAQQAAVKGGDPLRAVLGPQQHAVAGADALPGQKRGKTAGEPRQLSIRGDAAPVALVAHHGNLAVEAAKIIDQCGQMVAHKLFGKFMVRDEAASAGCCQPGRSGMKRAVAAMDRGARDACGAMLALGSSNRLFRRRSALGPVRTLAIVHLIQVRISP